MIEIREGVSSHEVTSPAVLKNLVNNGTYYPEGMTPVAVGTFGGIQWAVCESPFGGQNGYIKLHPEHPWRTEKDHLFSSEDDGIAEASEHCNGGVTFNRGDWIGFDTSHAWDYWPDCPDHPGSVFHVASYDDMRWWSTKEVISETKNFTTAAFDAEVVPSE